MTDKAEKKIDAWHALFRAQLRARNHIDCALKKAKLPGLETYDALLELDREDAAGGLVAKQLEQRLLLPQYGVSRLLDRLEKQGLLRRKKHPTDQRSSLILITDKGRALRQQIWAVLRPAIESFFEGRLRPGQLDRLSDLLGPLTSAR